MAITFQRAPILTSESDATSGNYNKLAKAFNDRIKSGIGDGAWRIAWQAYSFSKQIRTRGTNPYAFPPADEWLKLYANVPQSAGWEWPLAPVGSPEGLNVGNQIAGFIVGNPSAVSEADRLSEPTDGGIPFELGGPAETPSEIWALGKEQRGFTTGGLFDSATIIRAPALSAAQSFAKMVPSFVAKQGLSYGGFFPSPEVVDWDEYVVGDTTYPIPIYKLTFTPLRDPLPVLIYYGFAATPAKQAEHTPHLSGLAEYTWAYHLWDTSGNLTKLNKDDYILGPFTGSAHASHTVGPLLELSMNNYALQHRGADTERVTTTDYARQYSADWQSFFTRQYPLAPAYGVESGGQVVDATPEYTWPAGTVAAGTLGTISGGSTYAIHTGFRLAGVYVEANDVTGSLAIEIRMGAAVIGTVVVSLDDTGSGATILPIDHAPGIVSLRLLNEVEVGGTLFAELLELLDYKPYPHDAYFLARCAGAQSALVDTPEPLPWDTQTPKQFTSRLATDLCIVNRNQSAGLNPTPQTNVPLNAWYETTRRLIHDNVRMVSRGKITNYYVDEFGKSHIVCNRYALTSDFDTFDGMADSIRAAAGEAGLANEWVCFFSWVQDDTGLLFRPDTYGDILGHLNNPLHCWSTELGANVHRPLRNLFTVGNFAEDVAPAIKNILVAEAPPGYCFVRGLNDPKRAWSTDDEADVESRRGCYRSGEIYKAPYYIESVTALENGLVDIALAVRIQHCDEASPTVSKEAGTWDLDALAAEPWASDENRLRKYIARHVVGSTRAWPPIPGDMAPSRVPTYSPASQPDSSAILPRLHMVRLVPTAYEDNNDTPQATDTLRLSDPMQQMAWYAHAMAEGYVDSQSTASDCDNAEQMWDYTIQEATRQANGLRRLETVPDRVPVASGFGPLPAVNFDVATVNQYSRLVNLMTRVRIDLPVPIESRVHVTIGEIAVTPADFDGSNWAIVATGSTVYTGASGGYLSDWDTVEPSIGESATRFIKTRYDSDLASWVLRGEEQSFEFRFAIDSEALQAVPISWRDMVNTATGLFLEKPTHTEFYPSYSLGASPPDTIELNQSGSDIASCQFYEHGTRVQAASPPAGYVHTVSDGSSATISRSDVAIFPAGGVSGDGNLLLTVPLVD